MRPRTAAIVVAAAAGLTAVAVATTLARPEFGAAAAPPVAHPNPAVSNITIDYAASPHGPNGKAVALGPLLTAVLRQAVADQQYLAYQTAGDLGGFRPAPIGHLALSSGGRAVVGDTFKAEIPHYAQAGDGKIDSFALIGSPAPSTTPPDNGLQPVPGLGIPPSTPPATTTAPPPNQGFGGTPTTSQTTTATTPASPATTTTRPPGTTTATAHPAKTTGTTTATARPPKTTGTTGTTTATTTTGTGTTTAPSTTTAVTTAAITTTPVTTTSITTTPVTTTAATTTASTTTSGGSSGGGTTTTSNASCGTTGLSITSDHSSCRIDATNMAPGGSASEVMTIKNESDTAYKLYLRATGTQNSLWNDLELGVWKTGDAAPNTLPPLLDWTSQDNDLGVTLQPGGTVKLTLELHLKSTSGNADQNKTATIDFVWKAKS